MLNNMNQEIIPQVLQAVAGAEHTVYAYMNDGAIRLVDMLPARQRCILCQNGV